MLISDIMPLIRDIATRMDFDIQAKKYHKMCVYLNFSPNQKTWKSIDIRHDASAHSIMRATPSLQDINDRLDSAKDGIMDFFKPISKALGMKAGAGEYIEMSISHDGTQSKPRIWLFLPNQMLTGLNNIYLSCEYEMDDLADLEAHLGLLSAMSNKDIKPFKVLAKLDNDEIVFINAQNPQDAINRAKILYHGVCDEFQSLDV